MEFNFGEIITVLIKVVLIPMIPIVVNYGIKYLQSLTDKLIDNNYNENYNRIFQTVSDIILQSVVTTSNTYVEELKKMDEFDKEHHKIAFDKTKANVMKMLTADMLAFLSIEINNIDQWIDTKIEQTLNETKQKT